MVLRPGRLNPHLLIALALTIVFHGGLLLSGTFKHTYDAYIHIFFADHYVRAWFDPWEYRWYTGFTLTSYPPGSQQSIAILSYLVGLLNGFIIVQMFAVLMVVLGVYRFSKIWVSEEAAGYAALLTVFSSSIGETIHVFGQLPTTFSLGFLLNALPYLHRWLVEGDWKMLAAAWLLNAATTAGHHVTTLFGAIFFVGPVIAGVIVEKFRQPLPDEPPGHPVKIGRHNLRPLLVRRFRRIVPVTFRAGIYGVGMVGALVLVVLPYWLWSKSDPISQVPIPHASRDSYITNINAGIVFWLVPYGVAVVALPYAFYKGITTRAWPMTLSLGLLFLLGTGGTTPLPKLILAGAYDILTLDRFTFWATITVLPLLGEYVVSLRHGGLARYLRNQFGNFIWRGVQAILVLAFLGFSIFTVNFTQFRRFQPASIEMQPIVDFLQKDEHWRWRYLPLGFGDQMAWLSAQTTATTVDGNYHSARRLPELTSTSIERLEGAKFRGIEGIGSLQQFLGVPEKYNLKFVFSNDQFYDPLLEFSGWQRLQRLENGIMVWEREDIPPLPEVLPRKDIPVYQRLMWGILPMASIGGGLLALTAFMWGPLLLSLLGFLGLPGIIRRFPYPPAGRLVAFSWRAIGARLEKWSYLPGETGIASRPWQPWHRWRLRLKQLAPAPQVKQRLRTFLLTGIVMAGIAGSVYWLSRQAPDPVAVIEAYYDDLDFRRFGSAYERLDPSQRPSFEQYRLEQSVVNGLVASYGKLDSVTATVGSSTPDRVELVAHTTWITSLSEYKTDQGYVLLKRNGQWYIKLPSLNLTTAPNEFFSRPVVTWHSQGRRAVTIGPTEFADILDRPELQLLSARLVKFNDRYSVVGELYNQDVDPADLTVTSYLYDQKGNLVSWYNAQTAILHKVFPKEVTPFRIDFEGVAGTSISDALTAHDFKPGDFTPAKIPSALKTFDVYAKGVVTGNDLYREVAVQNLKVSTEPDGQGVVSGTLLNSGVQEATIPHLLITYYDANNKVVWVDQAFLERSILPQLSEPFIVKITPFGQVQEILNNGNLYASGLSTSGNPDPALVQKIPLLPGMGYTYLTVSVNYFVGNPK